MASPRRQAAQQTSRGGNKATAATRKPSRAGPKQNAREKAGKKGTPSAVLDSGGDSESWQWLGRSAGRGHRQESSGHSSAKTGLGGGESGTPTWNVSAVEVRRKAHIRKSLRKGGGHWSHYDVGFRCLRQFTPVPWNYFHSELYSEAMTGRLTRGAGIVAVLASRPFRAATGCLKDSAPDTPHRTSLRRVLSPQACFAQNVAGPTRPTDARFI